MRCPASPIELRNITRNGAVVRRSNHGHYRARGLREASHTQAIPPDGHDGTLRQVGDDGRQVCEQQRGLVGWASRRSTAEQDHRGLPLSPQHEERAKVGVGRHDDPTLCDGELENGFVVGFAQSAIANMHRIVPCGAESLGDRALSTRKAINSRATGSLARERLRLRSEARP